MNYIIFFKRQIITKCPDFIFFSNIKIGLVSEKYLDFILTTYKYAIKKYVSIIQFSFHYQTKSDLILHAQTNIQTITQSHIKTQSDLINIIAEYSNINTSKIFFNLNTDLILDGNNINISICDQELEKTNIECLKKFIPNVSNLSIKNQITNYYDLLKYLDQIIYFSKSGIYVPFIYFPHQLVDFLKFNSTYDVLEHVIRSEYFIWIISDKNLINSISQLVTYTLILDAIVKKYNIKARLGFYIFTTKIVSNPKYLKSNRLNLDLIINDIIMNELNYWR